MRQYARWYMDEHTTLPTLQLLAGQAHGAVPPARDYAPIFAHPVVEEDCAGVAAEGGQGGAVEGSQRGVVEGAGSTRKGKPRHKCPHCASRVVSVTQHMKRDHGEHYEIYLRGLGQPKAVGGWGGVGGMEEETGGAGRGKRKGRETEETDAVADKRPRTSETEETGGAGPESSEGDFYSTF